MVDCRLLGGKDDAGRPFSFRDGVPGGRQADEACNEKVTFMDLLVLLFEACDDSTFFLFYFVN